MSQTIIVTGAQQGLGRAIAERFHATGATVVGLDLAVDDSAEFRMIQTDVTSEDAVRRSFETIAEEFGIADVCINAAGVYPRTTIDEFTVDRYRLIFDVNVLGTWLVARAFALMGERSSEGLILNISSEDGITPEPKSLLYSASKAAVINLTRGMATDLAARRIRTLSIAPSYIATDRIRAMVDTLPEKATTPEEVAETVWRLSQPSAFPLITGQTVVTQRTGLL
jgi:3-oxoacyl-[acyl-carrier protein] reductase